MAEITQADLGKRLKRQHDEEVERVLVANVMWCPTIAEHTKPAGAIARTTVTLNNGRVCNIATEMVAGDILELARDEGVVRFVTTAEWSA